MTPEDTRPDSNSNSRFNSAIRNRYNVLTPPENCSRSVTQSGRLAIKRDNFTLARTNITQLTDSRHSEMKVPNV